MNPMAADLVDSMREDYEVLLGHVRGQNPQLLGFPCTQIRSRRLGGSGELEPTYVDSYPSLNPLATTFRLPRKSGQVKVHLP